MLFLSVLAFVWGEPTSRRWMSLLTGGPFGPLFALVLAHACFIFVLFSFESFLSICLSRFFLEFVGARFDSSASLLFDGVDGMSGGHCTHPLGGASHKKHE